MKQFNKLMDQYPLGCIVWISIGLNVWVEVLSTNNVFATMYQMAHEFDLFILNGLMIMLILSTSLFFKRRSFVCLMLSLMIALFGLCNYFVLLFRTTPLTYSDIKIFKLDMDFMKSYMSIPVVIVMMLLVVVVFYMVYMGWHQTTASKVHLKRTCVFLGGLCLLVSEFYSDHVHADQLPSSKSQKYGVITSFVQSTIDHGMDEPINYQASVIAKLMSKKEDFTQEKPNIIFVQLESFFDPTLLQLVTYDQHPMPNFTALKQMYPHGKLSVPVLGGGTVNTEFEVLVGMDLDQLGVNEYPYDSIAKHRTIDSVAYHLKEIGYTTYAIHNHDKSFYDRDRVYPNLGFDYFISEEEMKHVSKNEVGWIKDKHLTKEIMNCLNDSKGSDFIWTISMQGHGAYLKDKNEENIIQVLDSPYTQTQENQLAYYASQIAEMDQFIAELIKEVNQLHETTYIVFYGDHLPPLQIEESDVLGNNLYETEYLIYANKTLPNDVKNIESYQLTARLAEITQLDLGIMPLFHIENQNNLYAQQKLSYMMYDLLYGNQYSLDQQQRIPTAMKMGLNHKKRVYSR